ncbi:MAG TPA: hypothetical protein VLD62_07095 [Acidimicrobiia bacterium]|nr:hypothetical protein [Acidimicrobiia bacterium]
MPAIDRRVIGLLGALALMAAACSTTGTAPSTTTASTSSTSTTSPTTTSTSTTQPSTTSTTVAPQPCDAVEIGLLVDLDGSPPFERAFVTASDTLVVCDDGEEIASVPVPPGTRALGVVDVDDASPLEIALFTPATSSVRIARVTLRGLEVTDVGVERTLDDPGGSAAPFTGSDFECADIDDDGANELLAVSYRSAATDDQPTAMNVRVGVVVADGPAFTTAGVDVFELSLEDARARYDDTHRCEPGAAPRVSLVRGPDGWAVLESGAMFDGPGDSLMAAVAVDPATGRHVAVGTESPNLLLGEFFETRPVIWWSDDLLDWARADLGASVGELRDVTALPGGGFVAVGRGSGGPNAWHSDDGLTWASVAVPVGSADRSGQFDPVVSAVTVTPWGLVAVGVETYEPSSVGPGEDLDPAIWVSADGTAWERVTDPSLGTPGFQPNTGSEFNGAIVDVAFVPGIGVVAAGSASAPDPTIDYPDQTPTVWVSVDGRSWDRRPLDLDGRLRGVIADAEGAVVFGVEDLHGSPTSDALVATSTDGLTWTQVEGPFGAVVEPDGIQSINGGRLVPGLGLVLVGSDEAESEARGAAAIWWRTGGQWQRHPAEPSVFGDIQASPVFTMTDAAWSDALVVVGFSGRSIELPGGVGTACCIYEPAVWVFEPVGGS